MLPVLLTSLMICSAATMAKDEADAAKPLFNGKDFAGWHSVAKKGDPEKGEGQTELVKARFKVVDGVIVVDGKTKGDVVLTTNDELTGDLTIRFDYLAGPTCNNDLYFRGTKFDIKAKDIANLKAGEWNHFEMVAKGKDVEFRNNGELIKTLKAKANAGTFGLRAEAGAIQYKNLTVTSAK